MKLSDFLNTWKGVKLENQWNRFVILGLVLCNIVLLMMVSSQKSVITLVPSNLSKEVVVSIDSASPEMHRAMGMQLSLLLGNVTPSNAKIVKDALSPMLSSKIYSKAMAAIDDQILAITQDRVSTSFEVQRVEYEPQSGKTYVFGRARTSGLLTQQGSFDKTYEFKFRIQNYQPEVVFITNYRGAPRNIAWQEAQKKAKA